MDEPRAARQVASAPLRSSRRSTLRRVLLLFIALLYVLSIPWYRGEETPSLWWGLPDWVAVAVACYAGVAVLNALAWLLTEVPDGRSRDGDVP